MQVVGSRRQTTVGEREAADRLKALPAMRLAVSASKMPHVYVYNAQFLESLKPHPLAYEPVDPVRERAALACVRALAREISGELLDECRS